MIDPDPEENKAETSNNISGPSISNAFGVLDKTSRHNDNAKTLWRELESHAQEMQDIQFFLFLQLNGLLLLLPPFQIWTSSFWYQNENETYNLQ